MAPMRAPRSPPSPRIRVSPATWRCPPGCRGSWLPKPANCSPSCRRPGVRPAVTRSTTSRTCGARCGISSPPRAKRPRAHERRLAELRSPHRGAGCPLRPRVSPGRFRGGSRQLHDGDRRLRSAGAHAALVVRRALYLSADPAPHGALAAVRGGVPRQPGPCLPRREQRTRGKHPGDRAANPARQIQQVIETHGAQRVEVALDAALALEQHVDIDQPLRRERYPEYLGDVKVLADDQFRKRFAALEPLAGGSAVEAKKRAPLPPHPERDLLWFVANYAPEMESWERDIFLAVREESFYFYPVFASQIMNEGWASYWHARLLREADFIPQQAYLDAIKCHSDVVRPIAAEAQVALSINPYHLGFAMWEKIVEKNGLPAARAIMQQDDDFSFVRNPLTRELADELGLFRYSARSDGQIKVLEHDLTALHEAVLAPKYNFGAPIVSASLVRNDGTLELTHDSTVDGRGLDLERSRKVLDYLQRVWRRPIVLTTVNQAGSALELTAP